VFGGAELPALWAAIFVSALADAAIRFVSLARIEEALSDRNTRERYASYLEAGRAAAALCVAVRVAATVALVALVALRAQAARGTAVPALLAAVALVLLAELAARMIGRRLAPQVLLVLLPPLYWLSWPLRALDRSPESEPDEPPEPAVVEAAKEERRVAIEDGTIEGALGAEQKEMIEGILNFRDVDVGEIMTPRTDMECLEAALPLAEAVRSLSALRHSRIPVYEGSLDRITGIAYVKDLLTALIEAPDEERLLRDVVREPLFVPETKTVRALLAQFQREHIQIAIVLDEYGGVAGLLTVEDIMEEIVGEIQDEYDQEDLERRLVRLPTGGFEVDARMHIDEVNELLGLDIPEHEDYDTLGGFVTAAMARVPAPGEEIRTDGILVRVLEGDARRVRRVLIERPAPDDAGRP
jgi:putative hemolysin